MDRIRARTTVYVVDADLAVRQALAFTLDLEGFQVETLESGEALLLQTLPVREACLVIDEGLPGVSGLETIRQLRARGVTLPAILMTGDPKPALMARAAATKVPVLEKPLPGETLVAAIYAAV